MKNLYLLRHAKSSWDDFALKDYDRPLSTRGIQDADLMGNFFKSKRKGLDLVISSPSKRTKETLEHFFNKTTQNIIFNETLYHSSEHNIYSIIKDVEEEIRSLMIVGHNPSMHEFSESFSGQYIEKFSTCGLASFEFDDEWASIYEDSGTLFEFKIPSELR
tara:strand:- start:1443 stop:1925 length:483 start_codon:yes stop_codon:yes gene_type:complete